MSCLNKDERKCRCVIVKDKNGSRRWQVVIDEYTCSWCKERHNKLVTEKLPGCYGHIKSCKEIGHYKECVHCDMTKKKRILAWKIGRKIYEN